MAVLSRCVVGQVAAAALATGLAAHAEHITFAIPEAAGRISLGVADDAGRIVRTLSQLAPVADFKIDLNGLSLDWDMHDEAGEPLPPGTYKVVGWFIPDKVGAEGTALLFNDWAGEDGGLPMRRPVAVAPSEGDNFWVVGEIDSTGTLQAWRADLEGLKGEPLALHGRFLAAADGLFISVPAGGGLRVTTPAGISDIILPEKQILAASAGEPGLAVLELLPDSRTRVHAESSGTFTELPETPAPAHLIARTANRIYVADENQVWTFVNDRWEPFPLGDKMTISSLAAGAGDSLWISSALPGDLPLHVVRQYAEDGSLLRQLETTGPATIAADTRRLRVFVLTREGGSTRLRGLQPMQPEAPEVKDADGTVVADWDLFLDRVSDPAGAEAFWAGDPRGGNLPNGFGPRVSVQLAPNSFDATPGSVQLAIAVGGDSVWLEDARGLRITEICRISGVLHTALSHGINPGTVRAFVGTQGGIAEFTITGLAHLVRLDAGSLEIRE